MDLFGADGNFLILVISLLIYLDIHSIFSLRYLFSRSLHPSTTYCTCPGAPIFLSKITLYVIEIMVIRYIYNAHWYVSSKSTGFLILLICFLIKYHINISYVHGSHRNPTYCFSSENKNNNSDTSEDGGRHRHLSQGAETGGGGWGVVGVEDVKVDGIFLQDMRGGGEIATYIFATKMNGC